MLVTAAVVAGIFYIVGQFIASQPLRNQQEVEANRELTVTGLGEIVATPDIASITLGLTTGPQIDASQAVALLGEQFSAIVETLGDQGVKEEDIKTTNLSINPEYDYTDGRQRLRGFSATEIVVVKIRDLKTIGTILAAVTKDGINQAGGVTFAIDDPSELQTQAEELAIADAKTKAKRLAEALGANLGEVKLFSASNSGQTPPMPLFAQRELAVDSAKEIAPPVPAGNQEITSQVTITYSLR